MPSIGPMELFIALVILGPRRLSERPLASG